MRTIQWILLAISTLALIACTDGNPSLSILSSIDGITFSAEKKSSEVYKISTSPSCSSDLTITGHCDQRFNQLQFSIDNEVTWTSITGYNTNSNGDCSDGEFKLYFPDACTAFNVVSGADTSKKILIRADQKISQNTTREAIVNFTSEISTQVPIASIDNAPLTEGSTLTFTISLSTPSVGLTTVNYSFTHITTTDDDFMSPPGSGFVTFTDGQQTALVNFVTFPDTTDEDDQTFNVTLTTATGATISTTNYVGLGTIIDDDLAPTLNLLVSSSSVMENGLKATFSATLSAISEKPVTVSFSTVDISAIAPEDYTAVSAATLTITPGNISENKQVTIIDDTIDEPKQCFEAYLANATNATLSVTNVETCIVDNDSEPTVSVADVTVTEGGTFTFVVQLSAASQQTFALDYAITHGTTTSGDFQTLVPSGSVTFSVGNTSKNVTAVTLDDALIEGTETFTLTVSNPTNTFDPFYKAGNISISDGSATGTITDNEVYNPPTLTLLHPTNSPGASSLPTIRASGASPSETVRIYSDNTCTTLVASASTGSGSSVDITLPTALTPGEHQFYTTRDNGMVSACSVSALNYTYAVPSLVSVYPGIGNNWNDYVAYSNAGKTIYDQTDASCLGTEMGRTNRLGGCIHGGEKKKVPATGFAGCTGLTATDALGVFDWECRVVGSVVSIYMKGLKTGKGLRDLIDGSGPAWRTNSVTIYFDSSPITTTANAAWWTNPIVNLSGALDNSSLSSVVNLNDAGKIYILNSDQKTFGYAITADKVGVVTMPGATLGKYEPSSSFNCQRSTGTWTASASDDIDTMICAGNRKHLWIEANMNGIDGSQRSDSGLFLTAVHRSQIRNTLVYDMSHDNTIPAIEMYNSHGNVVSGLTIHNTGSGLLLQSASHNIIRNLNISHVYGPMYYITSGIEINGASADNNYFYNTRISNFGYNSQNSQAIYIRGPKNVFSKVNISNVLGTNFTYGIRFSASTANENILSQIVIGGTAEAGILFDGDGSKNVIANATILNNAYGIYFYGNSGTPKDNVISSVVIHNSNNPIMNDITIPAGPHGNQIGDVYASQIQNHAVNFQNLEFASSHGFFLHSNLCGYNFGSAFCTSASAQAVATLSTGDLNGPISVDDSQNPSDTNGFSTFSGLTMEGMLKFESWYRGWGKDFLLGDLTAMGSSTGDLRIWDFSPVIGGALSGHSGVGNALNTLSPLDATTCVSNAVGAGKTLTVNGITFFKNAIEIEGDFIGNDNELCELGEACIYAPNIGAVQPEGARSANYCLLGAGTPMYIRGN